MDPRATGTAARFPDSLRTPWSTLRFAPGLPVQCLGAVDAGAAPSTAAYSASPLRLDVPWTGAEVVLPARAAALPGAAAPVPAPRSTPEVLDPAASVPESR